MSCAPGRQGRDLPKLLGDGSGSGLVVGGISETKKIEDGSRQWCHCFPTPNICSNWACSPVWNPGPSIQNHHLQWVDVGQVGICAGRQLVSQVTLQAPWVALGQQRELLDLCSGWEGCILVTVPASTYIMEQRRGT